MFPGKQSWMKRDYETAVHTSEKLKEDWNGTGIANEQLAHEITSIGSRVKGGYDECALSKIWVQDVPNAKSSKSRETDRI